MSEDRCLQEDEEEQELTEEEVAVDLSLLDPAHRAFANTLMDAVEAAMRAPSGAIAAHDAVGVLCSLAANLISTDPSAARRGNAVAAFTEAFRAEVDRLHQIRFTSDERYRAAVIAEAGTRPDLGR